MVILTFATILPVIEIPFVLIQVSKGCCVYYAHNLNFFFNALKLSKTSTNGLLQIHQVQKCDIISLGKFGTNKKKKNLYILQTWLDMCINLSFTIVRFKARNQSFPYLSFLFLYKMSKGNLTYSCHTPTYALHHFINDKINMVYMYKQILHQ